ncbi:MAG: hypothetical protein PHD50_00555 [Bacilli bacterium]|nr:hypothetical protein [Bacilli bacterium]
MNKTLHLAKVLLKSASNFSANASPLSLNKNRRALTGKSKILLYIVLAVLVVSSVCVPLGVAMKEITSTLLPLGIADGLFYMILPLATVALLIISIFTVISVLFLSTDNAVLLSMPLKPREIIVARFLNIILYTYLIVGMFIIPAFVGYGIATGAGVLFYIISLIEVLLLPIIPLSILLLLLVLILQYSNLTKHRDLFTYISMGLTLVIALGFNFVFQQAFMSVEIDPSQLAENIRAIVDGYAGVLVKFLPQLIPAINALTSSSVWLQLLNILIYIAASLAIFVVVVIIASPIYFKSIKGSDERGAKRKKKTSNDVVLQKSKTKGLFKSSIIVEWKLMVRSPIYFLNLIFVIILVPVIMIVSMVFSMSAAGESIDINQIMEALASLGLTLSSPLGFLVFFGALLFLTSVNLISSTAASRMGKSASFVKYIPCNTLTTVNIKTFWGNVLGIVPALLIAIALGVFKIISPLDMVALILPIIPSFLVLNYIGFIIDAKNPKLNWVNETQAVKSNLNSVFYLFGVWAIIGILVALGFLLNKANIPYSGYILSLFITVLGIVAIIIINNYFKKNDSTFFNKLS